MHACTHAHAGASSAAAARSLPVALLMGSMVGSMLLTTALILAAAWGVVAAPGSAWTWALVATLVLLRVLPLEPGPVGRWFSRAFCRLGREYFAARIVVAEGAAFAANRPYVFGLEPHSALPASMAVCFGSGSDMLPETLRGRVHGLVSSACFDTPLVRHLFFWLGFRSITRQEMTRLLQCKQCVAVVPGGVQECLHMQHGRETVFLRKRTGFVRIALATGAPLVPCFAFGQTPTLAWARLGPPLVSEAAVQAVSRRVRFVPMLLLGRWGTPIPRPSRITLVLGAPLEAPRLADPSDEQVQEHLGRFISAMQALFEAHKAAAGYPDCQLVVL